MKVLQVGKFYPPHFGGIETFFKNLCEGLSSSGVEVKAIVSSDDSRKSIESMNNIELIRMAKYGDLFSQPIVPEMVFHFGKNAKQYDIVHIHSPNPLAEMSTLLLNRKIPVVLTHHSDVIRQKFLMKIYKSFYRLTLNRTSRIVVATENHIRFSKFLPGYKEKCDVIPYGIDCDYLKMTDKLQSKIDRNKTEIGKYILFVGRLVSHKSDS